MYGQLVKKEADSDGEPISKGPFLITKQFSNNGDNWRITGEWTNQENMKYGKFICENSLKLQGKAYSKIWSVFKDMAVMVQTRNFRQCKSHHQKMIEQFGSIKSIADNLGMEVVKNKIKDKVKQQHIENPIIIVGNKPERNINITFSDPLMFPAQQNNGYREIPQHQVVPPKQIFQFLNSNIFPIYYKQFYQIKPLTEAQLKTAPKYPTPEFYMQPMVNGAAKYDRNFQIMQSFFGRPSQTSLQNGVKPQKQKEWIECHRIFMLWFHKLAKLTSLPPNL